MPLTRFAEDPLLSEEETLRRVTLMALSRAPTPDSARAILRAMLHFMGESAELAEPFVVALITPPMARTAEEPVLELLDHAEVAVREQAAFMLYRIRIRESSRARFVRALAEDRSAWVRAHVAKALALLGGNAVSALLAEAIDNEATPESISRMAEGLAILGQAEQALVLRDQAEQLWEREVPGPDEITMRACSVFVDALAARLDASSGPGSLEGAADGAQLFRRAGRGEVALAGGAKYGGFAAKVRLEKGPEVVLPQDSPEALALLQ